MTSDLITSISPKLPAVLKRQIAPMYFRYRSLSADRQHIPTQHHVNRKSNAPDHVLVIVIDALRPDFIPKIDMEFSHAIAPAPWTFPSITSLHTGQRPSEHGANIHARFNDEQMAIPKQTSSYPYFPTDLEAAGYETYAGCAFIMPFDAVEGWYQKHRCYNDAAASRVISDYQKWRNGRTRTGAYLHFGDLHAPVEPPQEYIDKYDIDLELEQLRWIRRYRTDFDINEPACRHYRDQKLRLHYAALEYISRQLNELLQGIQENTLIIITGDHGEGLWEHQEKDRKISDSRPNYSFGHGGTPFDEIARVPIGIHDPTQRNPSFKEGWPTLQDIPATILDAVTDKEDTPGHSWYDDIDRDRSVICEGTRYGAERKAIYKDNYNLIQSKEDEVVYTSIIDEGEQIFKNIDDDIESELISDLPNDWDGKSERENISEFAQSQLEELGYI